MTTVLIITVIILLPYFYNALFPLRPPVLENYFTPGQTFFSKEEGVTQTVIRQDGKKVYCELKFDPYAPGPPGHMHSAFDESGTIVKGTLSTETGTKAREVYEGERVILPKGINHRMYNNTGDTVILRPEKEEDYIPVELAYSLAQLYPVMDSDGKNSLKLIMKISVLDSLFDVIPAGSPPDLFNILKKVIKPYARLFGISPYDAKSKPV